MEAIIYPPRVTTTEAGQTITTRRISYVGGEKVPQAGQPKARRTARHHARTTMAPSAS